MSSTFIAKHPSEWQTDASLSKWQYLKDIVPNDAVFEEAKKQIRNLTWWDDAKTAGADLPASPVVHHVHPLVFIGQMEKIDSVHNYVTAEQLQLIMPNARRSDIDKYVDEINAMFINYGITTKLEQAHFISQVAAESGSLRYSCERYNWSQKAYFNYLEPKPETYLNTLDGTTVPKKDAYLIKLSDVMQIGRVLTAEEFIAHVKKKAIKGGNTVEGDGERFCGKGLIHLTWRPAYEKYAKYRQDNYGEMGTINTEYLEPFAKKLQHEPSYAVDSAGWFWTVSKKQYREKYLARNGSVRAYTKMVNGGTKQLAERKEFFERAFDVFELDGDVTKWLGGNTYVES